MSAGNYMVQVISADIYRAGMMVAGMSTGIYRAGIMSAGRSKNGKSAAAVV